MAGALGEKIPLSSPAEVKALVPDFMLKRAKEIVSSSKLRDISFQGPSLLHSSATCTGSNSGDNYSLSILINTESSNPTCQCSCPAASRAKGNLCKHVVALLLLRTKEAAKVAKDKANAAVLSEFKLAEDRLFEGRQREPSLSDSQATEVFVPSEEKGDNDISTTASSVTPAVKNNQKRMLPSWVSEGYCAPKKEVKERKEATKDSGKKAIVVKEEGKLCTIVDANKSSQTEQGKGKNRLCDGGATKKSSVKKRKDFEDERVQGTGSEAEESLESEQKPLSRAVGVSTRKKVTSTSKNGGRPAQKRRRTRAFVESDLSEDEPEALDDECSFEAKKDLALTTEDLVNLATEHLETKKSNGIDEPRRHNQSGESLVNDECQKNAAASRKKGSIFSVQGWNEIATKGLNAVGTPYSQETSQLPSAFLGDVNKCHSQGSGELGPYSSLPVCGDTAKGLESLGTADNVVDDMLGLIFGPTLSKTVNCRSIESPQMPVQDMNKSTVSALPEAELLDVVLPVVSNDCAPQPKKKSSLKDQVMMYLG